MSITFDPSLPPWSARALKPRWRKRVAELCLAGSALPQPTSITINGRPFLYYAWPAGQIPSHPDAFLTSAGTWAMVAPDFPCDAD